MEKLLMAVGVAAVAMQGAAAPDEVVASTYGWNATNATRCLQAALDSKAKRVIVDRQQSAWIVDPLQLRSDQEVVFAEGVVVEAMPGGFKGRNDTLFTARNVRNASIRGAGRAVLKMHKEDYLDKSRYAPAEWRHTFGLFNCFNIAISNLSFVASGGDGVYVSNCRRISLDRLTLSDHNRQGVSIISVDGMTIRNSVFVLTSGAPPCAGIDFEPNEATEGISNVLVERCVFSGNSGAGLDFHLTMLRDGVSRPFSAVVRNCQVYGNGAYGLKLFTAHDCPVKGTLRFENCDFAGNGNYAVYMFNKYSTGIKTSFERCRFDSRGASKEAFHIVNNARLDPFGGISFKDVTLITDADQKKLFFSVLPGSGMEDVCGDIRLVHGGEAREVPFAEFIGNPKRSPSLGCFVERTYDKAALRPLDPAARGKGGRCPWLRGSFRFLQYVPAAGKYPIAFRCQAVGRAGARSYVTVTGPDGKGRKGFQSKRLEGDVYELAADMPGVYVFDVMTYGHVVSIDSPFPGQGLDAVKSLTPMGGRENGRAQKYYFRVPAGAKEVAVAVAPAKGEPVATRLVAPDGTVAAEAKLSDIAYPIFAKRTNPDKAETWCVDFTRMTEDMSFMVAAPASPIVATDPALVFDVEAVR